MKKLWILLFLMFIFLEQAISKEIKFVQITDCHIRNDGRYLLRTVNEINKMNDIDFVVFTGDNIDKVNPYSLKLFLTTAKKIKFKTYITIGNKDVADSMGLDKKSYMKLVRKYVRFTHSSKPHYVFEVKDVVFVVPDGTKEYFPSQNGYFNKQELKWLDETLTKYQDKKVVILQHYPLLIDKDKPQEVLWKIEDYYEMLAKHNNVIAVVSGHYHQNREEMLGNVYNVITPALENGNYKVIQIDDNYSIYTSLIEGEDAQVQSEAQ